MQFIIGTSKKRTKYTKTSINAMFKLSGKGIHPCFLKDDIEYYYNCRKMPHHPKKEKTLSSNKKLSVSVADQPLEDSSDSIHPFNEDSADSRLTGRPFFPIFRVVTNKSSFDASLEKGNYFAFGDLIGKFYESDYLQHLHGVMFVGQFNGLTEGSDSEQTFTFEGSIRKMHFLQPEWLPTDDNALKIAFQNETFFKGYFKGGVYPWAAVGGTDNVNRSKYQFIQKALASNWILSPRKQNCNPQIYKSMKESQEKGKSNVEYFLPASVRFQIEDIREINLEKSMAKVTGYLSLDIQYNQKIQHLVETAFLEQKRKSSIDIGEKAHNKLHINLDFNRDFTLTLPLAQEEDEDEDEHSSGSQWSIQDKTWDIVFENDRENKIWKYRIWKSFKSEIDNSYGAFFAPFNLSILRIILSIHSFTLKDGKDKIKVNINCVDSNDTHHHYNPFSHMNDLPPLPAANRRYKISRLNTRENGEYIIADNRLTLFPYMRNIIRNKNTSNDDFTWNLGLKDRSSLFQRLRADPLSVCYDAAIRQSDVELQELQRWSYTHIEIPIYKYVVIDMLQIFLPLLLMAVISLFIFNQENGLGKDSGFTTLALRIINIASLMIGYVSLVPSLRGRLPPMPGITLVEIITYLLTIPNLLALLNSMAYYTIKMQQWQNQFIIFSDLVFRICLILSLLNLLVLLVLFIVYWFLEYKILPRKERLSGQRVGFSSPHFLKYMDDLARHRSQQYLITVEKLID